MTREPGDRDKERFLVTPAVGRRSGGCEGPGRGPGQGTTEVVMLDFFREGGWGMWPILVFGMVTVGAALRFARKPETGQLRFIAAMGLTTLVTTFHATWTDIAAVLGYLGQQEEMAEAQFRQILVIGLKESRAGPGTLGGALAHAGVPARRRGHPAARQQGQGRREGLQIRERTEAGGGAARRRAGALAPPAAPPCRAAPWQTRRAAARSPGEQERARPGRGSLHAGRLRGRPRPAARGGAGGVGPRAGGGQSRRPRPRPLRPLRRGRLRRLRP